MRIPSSPVISRQQFAVNARSQSGPVAFSLLNSDTSKPVISTGKKLVSVSSLLAKHVADTSSPFADVPNRPGTRQNSGTDSSLTPTKQSTARDPTPAVALTGNVGADAISLLSADLLKRGIDPASLGFTYSEQTVGYPGGSYVNRLITARVNGQTENYNAELVLKNPQIATTEILRLMPGYRST